MIKTKVLPWAILFITGTILVTSCARYVSYFDVVSYKNLTDLYAESKILTSDCEKNRANGTFYYNQLSHLRLISAQALEYEQKKKLNDNTVAQLKLINKSVEKMHGRYGKNKIKGGECVEQTENIAVNPESGCLRPTYCSSKMNVLAEKFDIAIETEVVKIKQKN